MDAIQMDGTLWTFLTAMSAGILAIIGAQVKARIDAKEAKDKAANAADNAQQAVDNTKNIANGFVGTVYAKLDRIISKQDAQDEALRRHLEWHLNHKEGDSP